MDLEHHSHGYGQCAYHIVLVPRYRHKIFLDTSLQKRCAELLLQTADNNGYRIHELQVAPDRVHIFLGIGPAKPSRRPFACSNATLIEYSSKSTLN
jgi:REP element-mobilizing transposase RayT